MFLFLKRFQICIDRSYRSHIRLFLSLLLHRSSLRRYPDSTSNENSSIWDDGIEPIPKPRRRLFGRIDRFASPGSCTLHFDASPYPLNLHPIMLYRLDNGAWREWTVDSQLTVHADRLSSPSHSLESSPARLSSRNNVGIPHWPHCDFHWHFSADGSQILPGRRPTSTHRSTGRFDHRRHRRVCE
jgi:hypothetical protein